MTAVLVIGGFMLLASAVLFLLRAGSRRAHGRIAGTPPIELASWRPGASQVAGTGVTDYGPGGPQVGPISGEDCTWYRVEVVRTPSRRSDDRTGEDTLGAFFSPSSPTLTDPSGRVVIDSRVLVKALDGGDAAATERAGTFVGPRFGSPVPGYVPAGLVGRLRSYEDIHLREVRLPPGREVYALGSVGGTRADLAVLAPSRWGPTVFTTDHRDQLLARHVKDAAGVHRAVRAFGILGLVMTVGSAGLLYLLVA
jgi:hypothetical protein